ncbi:isoaspartyl peptidase/L-asparaginase [Candidatus Micrarchaeota archaeon]|nr:isoaspartyl peptidase/L-asparaginase [Candidatus Micrarchaeota archaeon]
MDKPVLVVHGGAWVIPGEEFDAHKKGMQDALEIGMAILKNNGSAVNCVEKTIESMENSGAFDAGIGAVLNEEGEVELDAQIMKSDLSAGAVAAIRNYQNPISIARKVMDTTPHSLLVGEGAGEFAKKSGFPKIDMQRMISKKEFDLFSTKKDEGFGTVGAVALDLNGNMCSGTSTGGTRGKLHGRVGDSPLIGAGGYCDFETGGASATGHGESFMKILACKAGCDYLKTEKSAQLAAEKTISLLERRTSGKGGIIILRRDGDIGIAFNTKNMARGYATGEKIEVMI